MNDSIEGDTENANKNNNLISILILGKQKVGKTRLLLKYVENTYNENYLTTIGINYRIMDKKIGKKIYRIRLIDPSYILNYTLFNINYEGIMFVYDITNQESIDGISDMIKYFQDEKGKNFPMILLGNKIDEINYRQIFKEDGEKLAEENSIKFYEISCKKDIKIDAALIYIVKKITNKSAKEKMEEKMKKEGRSDKNANLNGCHNACF